MVKRGFDLFVSVSDDYCIRAMQSFFHPQGSDTRVISGESGAAGLAALLALTTEEPLAPARTHIGLDTNSTVLLLNTEGDTDPDHFEQRVRSA
jgi:diaminopropionate ammonia-lyase